MAVEAIVSAAAPQQAQAAAEQGAQAAQQQAQAAQAQAQAARQAAQEAEQTAREITRETMRDVQRQIRDAQRQAGRAGREGQPNIAFSQFPPMGPQIADRAVIVSIAFFVMCAVIAIGVPLVRAFARRMDKRNAASPGADADTRARLERIEQAVDSIAVEVERISEGQRFTTKVMSEMRSLPLPDAAAGLSERGGERAAVPLSRTREAR